MTRDVFKEIDDNFLNIVTPVISDALALSVRVRYIIRELGKSRGILKKKTTYSFGSLKLVMVRGIAFTRVIKVFHNKELVLHTDDNKTVHRYRDGRWTKELVPLYWKAKLSKLEYSFGIDYIDELCDHFDHNEGQCGIHSDRPCPCVDFKHEGV